ncbi:MAG TPA: GNAT family N-acetyltransferase [Caldimonas sp.]|nr:GNAT family N-acetyltransferase [Caldimonas sp.]HEX2540720.1 GNAT family N-acetyltransferase [Caldimonas sp.]
MSKSALPGIALPGLVWRWCRFDAVDVHELQGIHRARQQVFVVEQACAFVDADEYDEAAFHLAAWSSTQREPAAYARVLDPGIKYAEPSIGRVLTAASARGQGLGRELVARALAQAQAVWPGHSIRIGAQSRLECFYAGFGFVVAGEPYVEDGIPHVEMLRTGRVP